MHTISEAIAMWVGALLSLGKVVSQFDYFESAVQCHLLLQSCDYKQLQSGTFPHSSNALSLPGCATAFWQSILRCTADYNRKHTIFEMIISGRKSGDMDCGGLRWATCSK